MASIITATTTSGLTQSADNSGVLQLASGTGNLVTIPSVTGTAMVSGNMPAFSAYVNGSQTASANTATKIQFNTETFDTANCYDNSTNYRFTPNVAGYYLFNMQIQIGTSYTAGDVSIRKNGNQNNFGTYTTFSGINANAGFLVTTLLFMNGTTDFVEGWATFSSTQAINTGGNWSYFQGILIRSS